MLENFNLVRHGITKIKNPTAIPVFYDKIILVVIFVCWGPFESRLGIQVKRCLNIGYVNAANMQTKETVVEGIRPCCYPKNGAQKPAAMGSCFGLVSRHPHGTASK